MCAEIAQVILCYISMSYRPGRMKKTNKQKQNTKPTNPNKKPNKTHPTKEQANFLASSNSYWSCEGETRDEE